LRAFLGAHGGHFWNAGDSSSPICLRPAGKRCPSWSNRTVR
jgi:hypothetical protein